jgi:hypothetical protein
LKFFSPRLGPTQWRSPCSISFYDRYATTRRRAWMVKTHRDLSGSPKEAALFRLFSLLSCRAGCSPSAFAVLTCVPSASFVASHYAIFVWISCCSVALPHSMSIVVECSISSSSQILVSAEHRCRPIVAYCFFARPVSVFCTCLFPKSTSTHRQRSTTT